MNVYQMQKYCILWDEMAFVKIKSKQVFIGRLFGKMALKSLIKNDKPVQRNMGTLPELIVQEHNGNFELLKKKLVASIEAYAQLMMAMNFYMLSLVT